MLRPLSYVIHMFYSILILFSLVSGWMDMDEIPSSFSSSLCGSCIERFRGM